MAKKITAREEEKGKIITAGDEGTPEVKNKNSAIDDALRAIKTKFGDDAIMKLGERPKVNVDAIPSGSLGIDWALGIGGFPRGRIVEIYGPESSGKTTLTLHAIAEAQKKGGVCAFIDAEHAMDPEYAKKIGVKVDELLVSQPDTGEQALEIVESLVRSGKLDIIVIDSVAALTPKDEIEGEMGQAHVGKQARLMSQALRKLTAITAKSKTIVIFINQIRMQIGVMFGCLNYASRVTLADGTQEKIGKIVNQKMPVEVLSYDYKKNRIVSAPVTGWYKNGNTDQFLQITVYNPSGNGKAQLACTSNHPVLTPTGWRRAEKLRVGEKVLIGSSKQLNDFQMEIIRGSLLGDGNLSPCHRGIKSMGVRFRLGHGIKQTNYLKWKAELFKNIGGTLYETEKAIKYDMSPLPELYSLRKEMYNKKKGGKYLSPDFLVHLTPLSLGIWYMDDGGLAIRNKAGTKGRIEICVQAMAPESRIALQNLLAHRYDVIVRLHTVSGNARFTFDQPNTEKFLSLIKYYIHPSMQYKLLPQYKDRFSVTPQYSEPTRITIAVPIIAIEQKPHTRSMMRFDMRVRGHHNFLADNIIVHNSPETTTGGKALKFYTSVRIDIRRIAQIKKGEEVVGGRHRVKIVKNKVAAPFRVTEFDLMYNEGISKEGELLALGEKYGIIGKSGSSYSFGEEKLGRGYDAARTYLRENKKTAAELLGQIRKKLNAE